MTATEGAPAAGGQAVVEIHDLRFAYGDGPVVLQIPELRVQGGERLFVRGPSGSGKSTFLGLVAGVLEPPPGRLQVLGQDLAALSRAARDRFRGAHVGYLFQLFNLIPYLSVADNIGLACRLSPERMARLGERPLDEAVAEIAEGLDIADLLPRRVGRLSVGQQQRVAAARALLGAPELILADEPTSALDEASRDRFLELLFASCAASGAALLLVSHDRSLAPRFERELLLEGPGVETQVRTQVRTQARAGAEAGEGAHPRGGA